jgi:hypothetical protein
MMMMMMMMKLSQYPHFLIYFLNPNGLDIFKYKMGQLGTSLPLEDAVESSRFSKLSEITFTVCSDTEWYIDWPQVASKVGKSLY